MKVGDKRLRLAFTSYSIVRLRGLFVLEVQAAFGGRHEHGTLRSDGATEDGAAEVVEEHRLEGALDGTGTVFRVVAFFGDEADGIVVDMEGDALLFEAVGDAAELDLDNLLNLCLLQGLEHQDVVDAVDELGTKAEANESRGEFLTPCSGYGPSP